MTIAGTLTLTDQDGRRLEIDAADVAGFVDLLTEHAPMTVVALADGALDQVVARRAGVALYEASVEVAERNGATILVPQGAGGTDPVVALLARLADHVGADDLAARARATLLAQASHPTGAASGRHYARIHQWADYLLVAAGPVAVTH